MVVCIAGLIAAMVPSVHRMSVVVYAIHPKFADKVQVSVLLALQEEKTPVLNAVLLIVNARLDSLAVALDGLAVVVSPG